MKLVYFNGRGLAETSRLLLAVTGIKYEDFRYPLKVLDWSTHDMVRAEFLEDKENNKLSNNVNFSGNVSENHFFIPSSFWSVGNFLTD